MDSVERLFDTSGFPARWHCGIWSAELGWVTIISDLLVFAAYMAIPILLVYFIRRRRDVPFSGIFWLFCAFIAACGTTHLIEAGIFWWPAYRLSAAAKGVTAVVSWATVLALIPVLPRALALPGLATVNADLTQEIRARDAARAEVTALNAALEHRVHERTSQLSDALQQLEGFTYTVAHDLRAPLRHLQGFSSLLREQVDVDQQPQAAHYAERVGAAARRMGALVDDLLAFSRTGRTVARREAIDFARLVDEVWEELAPATAQRAIDWRVEPLPVVEGDRALLRTVWTNLLDNAIKFSAPRACAEIAVGVRATPSGEAAYYVRDNGVGFDMRYADRLFGVFERLHAREQFDGTGIGLATVRRIVEAHGGRVWVEAEVDRGATVLFTLGANGGAPA